MSLNIPVAPAAQVPAAAGTSMVIATQLVVPGGQVGPNGEIRLRVDVENYSGNNATMYIYLGAQLVYDQLFSNLQSYDIVIAARNSTQAQRTLRGQSVRETSVNLDESANVLVCVQKANAADVVRVARAMATVAPSLEMVAESTYQDATLGPLTVTVDDLASSPLPTRVTNDPAQAVRALATTSYAFPDKFFSVCSKTWPVYDSAPLPIGTSTTRTLEWAGTGWLEMQTAQATAAYSNPTGAAPAGISAAGLAKLDAVFASASTAGVDVMLALATVVAGAVTPAWASSLGATAWPLSIPAAGANRTALLNSLGFYVRFLCERYTGLYPGMTWYIEPLNEPNTPGAWSGVVADFVALVNTIATEVTSGGAGKVKMVCSSWTDRSGVTFRNPGSPGLGGTRQSLAEYIGNGGWAQFEVLTYHLYEGAGVLNNLNPGDAYRLTPTFWHNLAILDPLQSATTEGRFVGLQQMLIDAGLGGSPIAPGASCVGGKPLWITECGDGAVATRNRDWFIKLALIASALGVTRYFFYYWGNLQQGALPAMDIKHVANEYEAARSFLTGKTIQWVNATRNLSKVAASIDGVVYRFDD